MTTAGAGSHAKRARPATTEVATHTKPERPVAHTTVGPDLTATNQPATGEYTSGTTAADRVTPYEYLYASEQTTSGPTAGELTSPATDGAIGTEAVTDQVADTTTPLGTHLEITFYI